MGAYGVIWVVNFCQLAPLIHPSPQKALRAATNVAPILLWRDVWWVAYWLARHRTQEFLATGTPVTGTDHSSWLPTSSQLR